MALILHPPSSPSSFTTTKPHLLLHRRLTRISINSHQDSSTEQSKKPSPADLAKSKQTKGNIERASILRREPFGNPGLATPQQAARADELRKNDTAFMLASLGLGSIIILEGIALAASGFLPEAWDKLLVKYLYPSFTPTVFLFVAGTVVYGVIKYMQNENSNTKS